MKTEHKPRSLHWWCSLDIDNSSPETAVKTTEIAQRLKVSKPERKQVKLEKSFFLNKKIHIPDMAGVSTPSPITIQVPRRTRISKAVCKPLYFSSNNFTLELFFFSGGCSIIYVESASSATCLLGRRLTFACLHINEYRAKVPPAKHARKLTT